MDNKINKNKKRKLTALAAAVLCFSTNIQNSSADEIIVLDSNYINNNNLNSSDNIKKEKKDGMGAILWPIALAAVGGVAGHYFGKGGSTKSRNDKSGDLIGTAAGTLVGLLIGNKYKIKENLIMPVYDFFANLFNFGKPPNSNIATKSNPVYDEKIEKIEEILNNFVESVVILKLFKYSELSTLQKDKIEYIISRCSYNYEFINTVISDYIIKIRNQNIDNTEESKDEICNDLKEEIYAKVKASISESQADKLAANLNHAIQELNLIIEDLNKSQNIDNKIK